MARAVAPASLIFLAGMVALGMGYGLDAISTRTVLLATLGILGSVILVVPARWAMVVSFFYLSFEGMAKILTNYNPVIHVGMDLLLVVLCVRWFFAYLTRKQKFPDMLPPLTVLFALHLIWFFIAFANPFSLGLIPSLASWKVYGSMTVLYFIGYYLSISAGTVRKFMAAWIVLTLIQCALSLYQGAVGPQSVTSLHPGYAGVLMRYQGYAFRPFGGSAVPGTPAIFVFMIAPFLIYFLLTAKSAWTRLILLAVVPACVLTLMLCQIRSALLKAMIGVSLFIILNLRDSSVKARKRAVLSLGAAATVLALALPYLTTHWIDQAGDNAQAIERTLSLFEYDKISGARRGAFDRILHSIQVAPLGLGLSRTGAAAGKFVDLIAKDPFYNQSFFTDNFWALTIVDLGIPGSLILTTILIMLVWRGYRSSRTMVSPELRMIATALVCTLIASIAGLWGAEGVLYNPEMVFFWFFAGALMRLPQLEAAPALTVQRQPISFVGAPSLPDAFPH